MENKWCYFQFRKSHDYPVYLRIDAYDLTSRFTHLFQELGFQSLSDVEAKKIQLHRAHTRILTVQKASIKLQLQINGSDSMDRFGSESISINLGTPIYTYRKVGMMAIPTKSALWELALNPELSQGDQMVGVRIILVRYLAIALSEFGVLSYWGTVKDGDVILMKQNQSYGEAVFVDWEKKALFSNAGETSLSSQVHFIRKDSDSRASRSINREEFISFLSIGTCLLNFQGITPSMKRAIFEMSAKVRGSYAISEASLNL